MSLPVLDYTSLTTFPGATPLLPIESFRAFGNDYVGVQTLFPADEAAWDFGDPESGASSDPSRGYGRWHGPAPLHCNAALSVVDAAYEELGHDDIARVSGAITAAAQISNRTDAGALTVRFVVQDAATGAVISTTAVSLPASQETAVVALSALSTGASAILWARVEGAVPVWQLPPDYYSVTGYANYGRIPSDYKYVVDDVEYVWDWLRDVGLRPSNPAQQSLSGVDMYAAHQALMLSSSLQMRGEWTTYIRSGAAQNCDWSALRLVEGEAEWEVGAITPHPGAALFRIEEEERVEVLFDALARSVSATDYDGDDIVLAGSIASRTGALPALWRMASDETATILGTHPNETVSLCEMALLSNFASDTILTRDGQRLLLTLSGLHEYDENKPVPEALPGIPRETDGHPGGRCLREHPKTGVPLFFTENFSGPPNFYNRLQEQIPGRRGEGPGTVFHGHNCADTLFGRYYGIHQNAPFSDTTAVQTIAFLEEGAWNDSELEGFPASAYRWQRVRGAGTPDGLKLLAAGKAASGEAAKWGMMDGYGFKEASLGFRTRRMTRVRQGDGTERVYAVGRFVVDGAVQTDWSVISLTGLFKKMCFLWDDLTSSYTVSRSLLEGAGFDVGLLPAYLWWQPDTDYQGGGVWLQKATAPESGVYLTKDAGATLIKYTLSSGVMPYEPDQFDRICFTLYDDGSGGTDAIIPETSCAHAACALGRMPEGTLPLFVGRETLNDWAAVQVSDTSDIDTESQLRRLHLTSLSYPILWLKVDGAEEDADDLSTYTKRIAFNRYQALPTEARARVDVVALVPPGIGAIRIPALDVRE